VSDHNTASIGGDSADLTTRIVEYMLVYHASRSETETKNEGRPHVMFRCMSYVGADPDPNAHDDAADSSCALDTIVPLAVHSRQCLTLNRPFVCR
jgi:hypothetical protein